MQGDKSIAGPLSSSLSDFSVSFGFLGILQDFSLALTIQYPDLLWSIHRRVRLSILVCGLLPRISFPLSDFFANHFVGLG